LTQKRCSKCPLLASHKLTNNDATEEPLLRPPRDSGWLDHSDFVLPDLWPPNSPDLNPVDYSAWAWSILQDKVYQHRINDFDELKHRLRAEWSNLNHAVIAATIRQWHRRLSACVKV